MGDTQMSVFFIVTVIKPRRFRYVGVTKTQTAMATKEKTRKILRSLTVPEDIVRGAARVNKINNIVEAARNLNFSESIENVELLSYKRENGKVYEDRFDCIDTTTIPTTVRFIGGTSYPNFSVSIANLTDESLDILCGCILRKNGKR